MRETLFPTPKLASKLNSQQDPVTGPEHETVSVACLGVHADAEFHLCLGES